MGSRNGGYDSKWGMGSEEEEDDWDPQYRLFLQNLKANTSGTGYTLHVERSNGTVTVKYEDKDEDELKPRDELKRKNPLPVSDCLPREAKSRLIGFGELQGREISGGYIGKNSKNVGISDAHRFRDEDELQLYQGKGKEKRGRGRPPKASKIFAHQFRDEDELQLYQDKGKGKEKRGRGRGRPPKASKIFAHQFRDEDELKLFQQASKKASKLRRVAINQVEKDKDPNIMGFPIGIASQLPAFKGRPECFHMGKSQHQDHVLTKSGNFRCGRINSHQTTADKRSDDLDEGKRLGSVVTKSGNFRRGRINSHQTVVDERSDDLDKGKCLGSVVSRRRGQLNSVPPEQLGKGGKGQEKVYTSDPVRIQKDCKYRTSGVPDRYSESFEGRRSRSDDKVSPDPPPSRARMTPQPSNKRLAPSGKRVPPIKSEAGLDSEFRQGAMDILLKPYDKKEHAALLNTAKGRAPLLVNRELRSGRLCLYSNESVMGKSYLDNHGDLKKKIIDAQRNDDSLKVLLLLRGFFFYIQRVCMDGQFEPWNDSLWLEAMNKSTS